jgi:hypothetical protein
MVARLPPHERPARPARIRIDALLNLFFARMLGQSEHEDEGDGQWCQAGPGCDPQCIGRGVVAEGREEDGAKDGSEFETLPYTRNDTLHMSERADR